MRRFPKINITKTLDEIKSKVEINIENKNEEEILRVIVDNRPLILLQISITYLGQKNIKEAEKTLNSISEQFDWSEALQGDIDRVRTLIDWVSAHANSTTFKNSFRDKLMKLGLDFWVGEKPKIIKPETGFADLFTLYSKTDVASQIRLHEVVEHHNIIESDDISEVVNSLEELIPNFRVLPENAQKSLIAAEIYKTSAKTQFDCSPSIMGYCKALEIFMKSVVFENYKQELQSSHSFEKYISERQMMLNSLSSSL